MCTNPHLADLFDASRWVNSNRPARLDSLRVDKPLISPARFRPSSARLAPLPSSPTIHGVVTSIHHNADSSISDVSSLTRRSVPSHTHRQLGEL